MSKYIGNMLIKEICSTQVGSFERNNTFGLWEEGFYAKTDFGITFGYTYDETLREARDLIESQDILHHDVTSIIQLPLSRFVFYRWVNSAKELMEDLDDLKHQLIRNLIVKKQFVTVDAIDDVDRLLKCATWDDVDDLVRYFKGTTYHLPIHLLH